THAPRHCKSDGGEYLPLRDVRPNRGSHSSGGRCGERRCPVNANESFATDLEPERYELYAKSRYRFAPHRRTFLKAIGGGIVVCLLVDVDESAAQPPPGGGRGRGGGFGGGMPQELGAWLHIDEKGEVSVYTGKVEVGQNVRTSLSQAVAEELRLPLASIHMVMADTDVVPFDMGTFGSNSTPGMAPQLARV